MKVSKVKIRGVVIQSIRYTAVGTVVLDESIAPWLPGRPLIEFGETEVNRGPTAVNVPRSRKLLLSTGRRTLISC